MNLTKPIPEWPACSMHERLVMCRVMLYQHGFLTEAEKNRVDSRIEKEVRKNSNVKTDLG